MRQRQLRHLHGSSRRRGRQCLPRAGPRGAGAGHRHRRRSLAGRAAASHPAGAGRARRHAMRLLHARHRAVRQGAPRHQPQANGAGCASRHCRQPVPLHRLRQDRRRRPGRRRNAEGIGRQHMDTGESGALQAVGKRLPRIDARERVAGGAIYPADLKRPGMVMGKILRSPHAHARIRRIDTTRAEALPGVVAVATAADFPELPIGASIPMGETGYDMWMVAQINMARAKVLWVGQPVAAVAAVDVHVAEAALDLIDVDYEPLPAVVGLAAAMAPDAAVLHEHVLTKGAEPRPRAASNICSRTVIARGDAAQALAAAQATAQIGVAVDTAHQGYLEPQVMVADVDANGFVTVWASTQGQFTAELMIARMLALPQSQLKVVPLEVGGAFGGKIVIHGEAVAARLAQKCGRPVKIVLTREEVMQGGSGPAAAAMIDVAVGAERGGRLTAIRGTYHLDAGGLPGLSPSLVMQASAALYQCPNLDLQGFDVVTNKPRTEAYRAPNGIQAAFAMEQAMDALSQRLSIDPLEFRKRNASVTGSLMPIGPRFPRSASPPFSTASAGIPAGPIRSHRGATHAAAASPSATGAARP